MFRISPRAASSARSNRFSPRSRLIRVMACTSSGTYPKITSTFGQMNVNRPSSSVRKTASEMLLRVARWSSSDSRNAWYACARPPLVGSLIPLAPPKRHRVTGWARRSCTGRRAPVNPGRAILAPVRMPAGRRRIGVGDGDAGRPSARGPRVGRSPARPRGVPRGGRLHLHAAARGAGGRPADADERRVAPHLALRSHAPSDVHARAVRRLPTALARADAGRRPAGPISGRRSPPSATWPSASGIPAPTRAMRAWPRARRSWC